MPNPLPLRTPFFDATGDNKGPGVVKSLGGINRAWLLYLDQLNSGSGSGSAGRWQIDLEVDGVLAIGSDQAPAFTLPDVGTVAEILASVQGPPIGASIVANINLDGALLSTVTVPVTATANEPVSQTVLASIAQIPPNTPLTLDLTAVGTTFPGQRLTVTLRGTLPGATASAVTSASTGGSGGGGGGSGSDTSVTVDGVAVIF